MDSYEDQNQVNSEEDSEFNEISNQELNLKIERMRQEIRQYNDPKQSQYVNSRPDSNLRQKNNSMKVNDNFLPKTPAYAGHPNRNYTDQGNEMHDSYPDNQGNDEDYENQLEDEGYNGNYYNPQRLVPPNQQPRNTGRFGNNSSTSQGNKAINLRQKYMSNKSNSPKFVNNRSKPTSLIQPPASNVQAKNQIGHSNMNHRREKMNRHPSLGPKNPRFFEQSNLQNKRKEIEIHIVDNFPNKNQPTYADNTDSLDEENEPMPTSERENHGSVNRVRKSLQKQYSQKKSPPPEIIQDSKEEPEEALEYNMENTEMKTLGKKQLKKKIEMIRLEIDAYQQAQKLVNPSTTKNQTQPKYLDNKKQQLLVKNQQNQNSRKLINSTNKLPRFQSMSHHSNKGSSSIPKQSLSLANVIPSMGSPRASGIYSHVLNNQKHQVKDKEDKKKKKLTRVNLKKKTHSSVETFNAYDEDDIDQHRLAANEILEHTNEDDVLDETSDSYDNYMEQIAIENQDLKKKPNKKRKARGSRGSKKTGREQPVSPPKELNNIQIPGTHNLLMPPSHQTLNLQTQISDQSIFNNQFQNQQTIQSQNTVNYPQHQQNPQSEQMNHILQQFLSNQQTQQQQIQQILQFQQIQQEQTNYQKQSSPINPLQYDSNYQMQGINMSPQFNQNLQGPFQQTLAAIQMQQQQLITHLQNGGVPNTTSLNNINNQMNQLNSQQNQMQIKNNQINQQTNNISTISQNNLANGTGSENIGDSVAELDHEKLQSRINELESKLLNQEKKAKADAQFMEEALQKRFEQMEAFEEKSKQLEIKCKTLEAKQQKQEHDIGLKEKETTKLEAKVKELESDLVDKNNQLDQLQKSEHSVEAIKAQKDKFNQKIQENFSLKQIIDQQKAELEKQKKRIQAKEDLFTNKQIEIDQMTDELKKMKIQASQKQKSDQIYQNQIISYKDEIKKLEVEKSRAEERYEQIKKQMQTSGREQMPLNDNRIQGRPAKYNNFLPSSNQQRSHDVSEEPVQRLVSPKNLRRGWNVNQQTQQADNQWLTPGSNQGFIKNNRRENSGGGPSNNILYHNEVPDNEDRWNRNENPQRQYGNSNGPMPYNYEEEDMRPTRLNDQNRQTEYYEVEREQSMMNQYNQNTAYNSRDNLKKQKPQYRTIDLDFDDWEQQQQTNQLHPPPINNSGRFRQMSGDMREQEVDRGTRSQLALSNDNPASKYNLPPSFFQDEQKRDQDANNYGKNQPKKLKAYLGNRNKSQFK